jgi:hypothetical protein
MNKKVLQKNYAPQHIHRKHPPKQMFGDLNERVTRSRFIDSDSHAHSAFVPSFEPKDVSHALTDESWINAMHEKLENFEYKKSLGACFFTSF